MRRRTPRHFYAFDILWLDGKDLRGLPLVKRKQVLRRVVPTKPAPLLYAEHFDARGVELFRVVCEVIEGLGEIVEVFFGPGRFQLPLVGPAHPVPAIARVRRQLGHRKIYPAVECSRPRPPRPRKFGLPCYKAHLKFSIVLKGTAE